MIKNIIFDVGMVLVDWCWRDAMEGFGFDEETIEILADATVRSTAWNHLDQGDLSDEEILAGFIENAPDQEEKIRMIWDNLDKMIRCYPYSHDWIRSWKEKGYKCYILSNYGKRTYDQSKEELTFEHLMDGVLFSYTVKQIKPNPDIYHTLMNKFGLKAEECIFLDDNAGNIEAARKLGIHAIQFVGKEQAEEEMEKVIAAEK